MNTEPIEEIPGEEEKEEETKPEIEVSVSGEGSTIQDLQVNVTLKIPF